VDSLVLEELQPEDQELLERSLKMYHAANEDTSRINALNQICDNMIHDAWQLYQVFQVSQIEKSLQSQHTIAELRQLKIAYASALVNTGVIYSSSGDVEKALIYYNKSLRLHDEINYQKDKAATLNNIGYIYKMNGNIPLSLATYHKSLRFYEEMEDSLGMAFSYNNIGNIHNQQGDNKLALLFHDKSLELRTIKNNLQGMAMSYNNIGNVRQDLGELDKALGYFKKSLTIYESSGDKSGEAASHINLGGIYHNLKQFELALDHFDKSLLLREELGEKRGITISCTSLGDVYLSMGQFSKAHKFAIRALDIAREIGFPNEIKSAAKLLYGVYKAEGRGMKALEMHELFILMRDSINNENTQNATVQLEAKYDYSKQKALDDKEYEKQISLAAAQKQKQRVISISISTGSGLLILFLIFVYQRLRITKKQKIVIEEQKALVDIKNTEILDSITYAKRIQDAMLPNMDLVKSYLPNSFILYKPKDIVAGDFYWLETQGDEILFAAADCTGHGVPGAMVSVVCHNAMNQVVRDHKTLNPGIILDETLKIIESQLNNQSKEGKMEFDIRDGMDIALCRLNVKTIELNYAGANNPLWIVRNGANEVEEIKATKQAIGMVENPIAYSTNQVQLNVGDTIYLFSDGYADQFGGPKGKKFMYKQLRDTLLAVNEKSMKEQNEILSAVFHKWKNKEEQVDDVLLIGVRV
jgi:serine phosphatase RsbU (regulator of sigma subunit)